MRKRTTHQFIGILVVACIAYTAGMYYPLQNVAKPAQSEVVSIPDQSVQYYFPRANQAPQPQLISIINSAKSSLDIAIYSFTDNSIASAVIAAKQRGVAVRVISDKTEAPNQYQKALLDSLKAAGIPVKINTHSGLMHLKVTIADKNIVTTGSFNYTKAAENTNDEVFVVLHSSKAAADFDKEFVTMWNDASNFKNY